MEICLPQSARLSMQKRDAIVQRSGGMPGKVIELLSANSAVSASRLFPLPPLHMAGIAVMLLLVLILSMWQFMPEEPLVATADVPERIAVPLSVDVSPAADPSPTVEIEVIPAPERPVPETSQQVPEKAAAGSEQVAAVEQTAAPVVERQQEQQVAVKSADVKLQADVAATVVDNVVPEVKRAVPETQVKPSSEVASQYSRDEQTLLGWPAKSYTLQVMGSRSEEGARKFIQNQSSAADFYYFATQYKAKPWYVVVYGQYSNRDAATSAIRELPAALQKVRPWARSLQSVQLDIKKKTN